MRKARAKFAVAEPVFANRIMRRSYQSAMTPAKSPAISCGIVLTANTRPRSLASPPTAAESTSSGRAICSIHRANACEICPSQRNRKSRYWNEANVPERKRPRCRDIRSNRAKAAAAASDSGGAGSDESPRRDDATRSPPAANTSSHHTTFGQHGENGAACAVISLWRFLQHAIP